MTWPPDLTEIAKSDPNERLAKTATYSIANVNSDQSTRALETILKEAKFKEVRKAALHSLANHADASTVSLLKQIALSKGDNEDDPDMQRTAVYALGNIRDGASTAALKEVLSSGTVTASEPRPYRLSEIQVEARRATSREVRADIG